MVIDITERSLEVDVLRGHDIGTPLLSSQDAPHRARSNQPGSIERAVAHRMRARGQVVDSPVDSANLADAGRSRTQTAMRDMSERRAWIPRTAAPRSPVKVVRDLAHSPSRNTELSSLVVSVEQGGSPFAKDEEDISVTYIPADSNGDHSSVTGMSTHEEVPEHAEADHQAKGTRAVKYPSSPDYYSRKASREPVSPDRWARSPIPRN